MQNQMYLQLLFLYCVLLNIFLVSSSTESFINNEQGTLQFVQMIFRHGDKNPEISYPNDPYKNESFWPGGWNNINDRGKRRMYQLGIYFRQRYSRLFSKEYFQNEIDITSTNNNRTIISAYSFLAGLYNEDNLESKLNGDIHWSHGIPVPVRILEKKYDRYLEGTEPCPEMKKIIKDLIYNSEFVRKVLEDHKEMVDHIVNHSGITTINFFTVSYVLQTLQIEKENGLELPAWTEPVLENKHFNGLLMKAHRKLHSNKQWTFLRSGPLTQKLISNVEDFIRLKEESDNKQESNQAISGKKMILFSAHDRTVVDMMLALNIYDPDIEQPPSYGATLIFELHRDQQNKYFFNVLYKNDSSATPYKMTIPNCGNPCYVANFKTITDNFMLGDWDQECQLERETILKGTDFDKHTNEVVYVLLPLLLSCTVFIFGGMMFINRL